ncbi:hypothetical protein HY479_03725 [Candidatus Uhrbacteria bacterium]|nr:hypothetical protein [Candidatus Uhrbacteria bacterium]
MFRIVTSHVRFPVPSPKQSFRPPYAPPPLRLILPRDREETPTFSVPRDGVIRAVASAAGRMRRSSPRIVRFDRVLRTYCGMVIGYVNRYTVGEYVYLKLKDLADRAKRGRKTLFRRDLEESAERLFADIEMRILAMAAHGTQLDSPSHRGYVRIKAPFAERKGLCYLTLGRSGPTGERKVLCLETKGTFRRRMRSRSAHRDRIYRNIPQRILH